MDAGGDMHGHTFGFGPVLFLNGAAHFSITIDVFGFTVGPETFSFPVDDQVLALDSATGKGFKGDLAFDATQAQRRQGFATTERGSYKAKRVKSCALATPPKLG
jgi:hypothetical protein